MIDGGDTVSPEHGGKNFLQDFAICQHVGDAAGHAEIVFEHGEAAIWQSHQVGAADADVNSTWNGDTAHLPAEMAATVNQFARYDAIGQNPPAVGYVFQEEIKGRASLGGAAFDLSPFLIGDDAGQQIVGENTLASLLVAVNREGDPLMQKG